MGKAPLLLRQQSGRSLTTRSCRVRRGPPEGRLCLAGFDNTDRAHQSRGRRLPGRPDALFVTWPSPALFASRVEWAFQTAPLIAAALATGLIVAIAFAVAAYKANQLSRVLEARARPTARPPVKRFWR